MERIGFGLTSAWLMHLRAHPQTGYKKEGYVEFQGRRVCTPENGVVIGARHLPIVTSSVTRRALANTPVLPAPEF
jgi:hypothetical protein